TVQVEMTAFALETREVDAKDSTIRANIALTLASRSQQGTRTDEKQATMIAGNRGFQSLSLMQGDAGGDLGDTGAMGEVVPPEMPIPGVDQNSATESISYSGSSTGSLLISSDELQQRMREARDQRAGLGGNYEQGPSGASAEQPGGTGPTALAPRGAPR